MSRTLRSGRSAAFLDRDGTIIEDVGYPHRADQLSLLPGAVEGLRTLAGLGFELVIVTNQSGIARGYFTEGDCEAFHALLLDRLAGCGVRVAGVYTCPYHPDATVVRYRLDSPLRKPAPGLLLQAAGELGLELGTSVMIGDKRTDVLAGRGAGCKTVLIQPDVWPDQPSAGADEPDYVAVDLVAAAAWVASLPTRRHGQTP